MEKRKRGRPRHDPPLVCCHLSLTEEHKRLLRMWGRGDLSAGLRWLIDVAAPLIRRDDTAPPRSSRENHTHRSQDTAASPP